MTEEEDKAEDFIRQMGHKEVKNSKTTTYLIWGVLKVKNNPNKTRWSYIKKRIQRALDREFGEDLV